MSNLLSRRTMLRGLGAAVALPMLDAMIPAGGLLRAAAAAGTAAGGAAKAAAPVRMAFMFLPNGVAFNDWTPTGEGAAFQLSKTLAPLEKVKSDVLVLSGLTLDNARAKGDGPGDHARSAAAFLTGAHPYKTAGKDIHLGVSVDQFAAKQVGNRTRMPSLEIGLDKSRTAGNCDSGYSCAYVSNISWTGDSTPVPAETDPGALFDRLFGGGTAAQRDENLGKRLRLRKSVLDFVADDAQRLNRQLGSADKGKLDEFTTSIREVEKRVEAARVQAATAPPKPTMARPDGKPGETGEYMRLMCDLLALSFQMDLTRISSVMIARDGSDRNFPDLGITEGHHSLSHHGGDAAKVDAIKKIDRFHMEQLAYFIGKLKGIKEGDGTLLDNCMLMCGSGIGDGNRHNHDNLPIVVAGRGGGLINPGRHVVYPRNTPLCNLYLSMLDKVGVQTDRFGDSDGKLKGLS